MTLGHLNRCNSFVFKKNKMLREDVNFSIKRYAKFRVDTCNVTDVIQENRGNRIRPPSPRRSRVKTQIRPGTLGQAGASVPGRVAPNYERSAKRGVKFFIA